jgi:hypothetical protein
MRTFSILIASAVLVVAFGSATMAEEMTGCAGHYDSKAGTSFGRCPGTAFELAGIQAPGASGAVGAATGGSSGGSSGGSATGGNK